MATILYSTSYGSDDSTRATIPFVAALGAVEAGHQPQVMLLGEATYLMKDTVADAVHGVGFAPLNELLPKIIEHGIPIYT
jgi:predicted peroxiredoxin